MATQVASLFGVLTLDDKQFQQGLDNAQSGLKTTGEKLQAFGGGMQKAGLLTMAAATPVLAFGANAVRSAGASQEAAAQLNAVLTSTGGVAGVTADGAQALASNLQNVTRYSDETVLSGENMLLTFTNIGAKGGIFDKATLTTLDMATALGMDVPNAAMTLGKALNAALRGANTVYGPLCASVTSRPDNLSNDVNVEYPRSASAMTGIVAGVSTRRQTLRAPSGEHTNLPLLARCEAPGLSQR